MRRKVDFKSLSLVVSLLLKRIFMLLLILLISLFLRTGVWEIGVWSSLERPQELFIGAFGSIFKTSFIDPLSAYLFNLLAFRD
jgi:hypothetical protein